MDTSLRLYKGKLKEAIKLVTGMNDEKKSEAVLCWNKTAAELQDIISGANYSGEIKPQQELDIVSNNNNLDHIYDTCVEPSLVDTNHCDPHSIRETSTLIHHQESSLIDSIVNPSINLQNHHSFHQDNLLVKTSIFDNNTYLNEPTIPIIHDSKNPITDLLVTNDRTSMTSNNLLNSIQSTTNSIGSNNSPIYAQITQTDSVNCSSSRAIVITTQLNSQPICSNNNNNIDDNQNNSISTNQYNIIKDSLVVSMDNHMNNNQQTSMATNKTILQTDLNSELFCPDIASRSSQTDSISHIFELINNSELNLSPLKGNVPLTNNTDYNNILINGNGDILVNRASDGIDNVHYNTETNLIDDNDNYQQQQQHFEEQLPHNNLNNNDNNNNNHHHHHHHNLELSTTPAEPLSASKLTESFTQTERPLQEIQPFCSNYFDPYVPAIPGKNHNYHNYRYLYCNTCNKQFDNSEDLNRHRQQTHSLAELLMTPSESSGGDGEGDNDTLKVTYINEANNSINRILTNGSKVVASTSSSSSFTSNDKNKNNSQHTCDVCGKSGFSTKGNLKRHLRAHSGEKPFKCDYCNSCFTEKKSLKIHVRRHTGEKPYKCQICGKLFSQTGVLQSHMALHLNERKFDCNKCGKAFRQRSQLKLHLMRHDGVKRLECSICKAKFLTKGDLERHYRIHTGERPYACKICNKTFTRQQSLNEHMNRHTGRKPYDCKYCDKSFSEMSACYKHAKTHKKQDQISIGKQNQQQFSIGDVQTQI